jgi:hypothetical protein
MVAGASKGTLETRPLTWAANNKVLFVNSDGGLTVEILSGSKVVLRSAPIPINSTRSEVAWADLPGKVLPSATAAAPLVLRFTLRPGARLFSFWVSTDRCGASGGMVAGGGPGFGSSRDLHGACDER